MIEMKTSIIYKHPSINFSLVCSEQTGVRKWEIKIVGSSVEQTLLIMRQQMNYD